MLKHKEIKHLTVLFIILLLFGNVLNLIYIQSLWFVLIYNISLLIIYLCSCKEFFRLYKGLVNVAISTKQRESNIPEKYEEGDLGTLAQIISDLIMDLQDSNNNQKKEKEFLQDMLADISHQIKTPVASLTVFLDILLDKFDILEETSELKLNSNDLETIKNILNQSEEQLERITWLVQSILQLARLEAMSIEFKKKETDLSLVIDFCVRCLKANLDSKDITVCYDNQSIMLNTDKEWLTEALINIIKNAIEYSDEHSNIDIIIKQTPIATKITIKDYGVGIKESEVLHIFKRFYRGDNHSTNPSSVGIGLALSKSIIESLGGKLWAESRAKVEIPEGEISYTCMNILF